MTDLTHSSARPASPKRRSRAVSAARRRSARTGRPGKSEPNDEQLRIVAAALGTTPAYLRGATDQKNLPAADAPGEEDPLDAQLRELLSHADDDLKQAMIAFLERFQKK